VAIGTNTAVPFFGTTDALDDTTTSAITNDASSVAADITAWTNTDDAPAANVILRWQYPSGTLDGDIDLQIRPLNVDGTSDTPVPTFADPVGYVGTFQVDTSLAVTTDSILMRSINLLPWMMKTSQEFEFYLINRSGVTISANWDLDIVPMALGPKA